MARSRKDRSTAPPHDDEKAFRAAIRAHPDDDTARLVYADWLQEHDREAEAELIRLGCRLDPDFERYDDDAINALRDRVNELTDPLNRAHDEWLRATVGVPRAELVTEWRRGFLETVGIPARWFVEHGAAFRERFPMLRRLVLFRLNGWGARVAACPALEGLPELELACWYGDDDAHALADSPHLSALRKLVVWDERRNMQRAALLARGRAWPNLQNLHEVQRPDSRSYSDWVEAVDRAAGRALGSFYNLGDEPFPFAVGSIPFLLGKLPDGRQVVAHYSNESAAYQGWHFDPDGRSGEPFRATVPPELANPPGPVSWDEAKKRKAARVEYLGRTIGFVPAFVRVEGFALSDGFGLDEADEMDGPTRYERGVDDSWGREDDPDEQPEKADCQNGYGERPYSWVRSGGYGFRWGDYRWHDRSGHCYMS